MMIQGDASDEDRASDSAYCTDSEATLPLVSSDSDSDSDTSAGSLVFYPEGLMAPAQHQRRYPADDARGEDDAEEEEESLDEVSQIFLKIIVASSVFLIKGTILPQSSV